MKLIWMYNILSLLEYIKHFCQSCNLKVKQPPLTWSSLTVGSTTGMIAETEGVSSTGPLVTTSFTLFPHCLRTWATCSLPMPYRSVSPILRIWSPLRRRPSCGGKSLFSFNRNSLWHYWWQTKDRVTVNSVLVCNELILIIPDWQESSLKVPSNISKIIFLWKSLYKRC